MNTIKDKIITSHWCFQSNLISRKNWLKLWLYQSQVINHVVINHELCVITLWMHYTLFIITFRRNKLIAIVNWVFPSIKLFKIIYDVFYVCSNFIKVFFNWWCSVSITVTLIFDIIVTPNIFFFYWFVIIFFKLRKVPNISYYAIFDCLIFFFQSKKISYISKCIVIYFFFFFVI